MESVNLNVLLYLIIVMTSEVKGDVYISFVNLHGITFFFYNSWTLSENPILLLTALEGYLPSRQRLHQLPACHWSHPTPGRCSKPPARVDCDARRWLLQQEPPPHHQLQPFANSSPSAVDSRWWRFRRPLHLLLRTLLWPVCGTQASPGRRGRTAQRPFLTGRTLLDGGHPPWMTALPSLPSCGQSGVKHLSPKGKSRLGFPSYQVKWSVAFRFLFPVYPSTNEIIRWFERLVFITFDTRAYLNFLCSSKI